MCFPVIRERPHRPTDTIYLTLVATARRSAVCAASVELKSEYEAKDFIIVTPIRLRNLSSKQGLLGPALLICLLQL